MDYIRYVDVILPRGLWEKYGLVQDHIMPEFDYGYHPEMRKAFSATYGYDPLENDDVDSDSLWLAFRLLALEEAVVLFRDMVENRGMEMTAAVFPTPPMAREMVRQDWSQWELDSYFPMVYHNFYQEGFDWIREVMKINKSIIDDGTKVYCGLFLPAMTEEGDLTTAMKAAFEGGADGIAFFDLRALKPGHLDEINEMARQVQLRQSCR